MQMPSNYKKVKQELFILPAFPIEASGLSRRVSFQYSSFIFLDELLYSFSRELKSFSDLAVSHIDKKGASLI